MTLSLQHVSYGRLVDVSLNLEPGLHVVVATPQDGSLDLLRLCAGDTHPTRGTVQIRGLSPHRAPTLRRQLGSAFSPDEPFEEHRVRDALALRLKLHGCTRSPEQVVEPYAGPAMLGRPCATLGIEERRLLQLALALALESPQALFLMEPLASAGTTTTSTLLATIRRHAERCVVLCATASPRTAALLSPQALLLEDGRLKRGILAPTRPALTPGTAARVRIECSHIELMARALSGHPAVSGLSWHTGDRSCVAEGPEVDALSNAVFTLAHEHGWRIFQLTQALPEPVEIRATHAALARAAYEAAHSQRQGQTNA